MLKLSGGVSCLVSLEMWKNKWKGTKEHHWPSKHVLHEIIAIQVWLESCPFAHEKMDSSQSNTRRFFTNHCQEWQQQHHQQQQPPPPTPFGRFKLGGWLENAPLKQPLFEKPRIIRIGSVQLGWATKRTPGYFPLIPGSLLTGCLYIMVYEIIPTQLGRISSPTNSLNNQGPFYFIAQVIPMLCVSIDFYVAGLRDAATRRFRWFGWINGWKYNSWLEKRQRQ